MNWKWPLICLLAAAVYAAVLFLGVDATWVRPRGEAALAVESSSPGKPVGTQPVASPSASTLPASPGSNPFASFTHHWRDDPAWHDGVSEIATYEVTRVIDGKPRTSIARIMTRKGFADPVTKTISAAPDPVAAGHREAFMQHTREDVPGESSTRHQSTMVFVGAQDLKSLKIDFAAQDDHGATFKQFVNHKGTLTWSQYSSLPGQGSKSGAANPPADFVFHNALPLALRGFPFDDPITDIKVLLLADQTPTQLTPVDPQLVHLIYFGKDTLDLPIGKTESRYIGMVGDKASTGVGGSKFWFAAEDKPPMLHVMVQYTGSDGTVYKLKSIERKTSKQ